MNEHVNHESLQLYVEDRLNDAEQQVVEEHLSDCETCFEHYLDVIDDWSVAYSVSAAFTDNTMEILQKVHPSLSEKKPSLSSNEVHKKKVTHYFLAAGLTILLMFSGVFQMIFDVSERINLEGEPLSQQILDIDLSQDKERRSRHE